MVQKVSSNINFPKPLQFSRQFGYNYSEHENIRSSRKLDLRCKSPRPRSLTNGRRVVHGKRFNETVIFTCDPGFILSGSSVRTCRGLGIWDGVEPKCGEYERNQETTTSWSS